MVSERHGRLARERRIGVESMGRDTASSFLPFASMGRIRLDHLRASLDTVREEAIVGDLVECGTNRGGGAIFMRGYLDAYEAPFGSVWVADRFRASVEPQTSPTIEDEQLNG